MTSLSPTVQYAVIFIILLLVAHKCRTAARLSVFFILVAINGKPVEIFSAHLRSKLEKFGTMLLYDWLSVQKDMRKMMPFIHHL